MDKHTKKPKQSIDRDSDKYRPCEQCGLCIIMDGDDSECQFKHLPKDPKYKGD